MTAPSYTTAGHTAAFLFAPPCVEVQHTEPPPQAPADVTLSPTAVTTFAYDCQVRYFYRKVLQLPEPNSGSRALGSAVHVAIAENFRDKAETGEDLPTDGVVALFRDSLEHEMDGAELQPEESVAEIRETGEMLVRVYMDQAAPLIQPAAVEMPVAGVIGGVPVRGYVDLLDQTGRVVDIKTAARKPSRLSAAHRLQLATYAILAPGASGEARLDTITKTKTVALHQQSLTIGEPDRQATARLYSIARDAIRNGVFIPNRGSFMCSRRHCAFWERCEDEYGGRVDA